MIVDCHTRIWASADQLGPFGADWLNRCGGRADLTADPADHALAARDVTRTLVWGFRSRASKADIPNMLIAEYVSQHAGRMIGIAAVDPPEPDCLERLANIGRRREFGGVTLSPSAQGFHPMDSRALPVYGYCQERHIPVFLEGGADLGPAAALEFARPHLLDEVARTFPALVIVIAGVGWPWVDETLALLAKQPRVYADVAGLLRRPWLAYQAILSAHHCGVAGKVLFGSDFPFLTAAAAIERLYRLNDVVRQTPMPTVPREVLRGIVERDALKELGIE